VLILYLKKIYHNEIETEISDYFILTILKEKSDEYHTSYIFYKNKNKKKFKILITL
jgi:hypothetical protein